MRNPPTALSVERVRLMHRAYLPIHFIHLHLLSNLASPQTFYLLSRGGPGGSQDSDGIRPNPMESDLIRWDPMSDLHPPLPPSPRQGRVLGLGPRSKCHPHFPLNRTSRFCKTRPLISSSLASGATILNIIEIQGTNSSRRILLDGSKNF